MATPARDPRNYETGADFPAEMTGQAPSPEEQAELELEELQQFSSLISKRRDEWIAARRSRGWDRQAQEDLDQYHAIDPLAQQAANMMESVAAGAPITQAAATNLVTRSTVFIGLTRQKSNAAEARLADIILPTDEKNWAIRPTPSPTLANMAMDGSPAVDPETGGPLTLQVTDPDGQPVEQVAEKRDVALAAEEVARKKAGEMEREIEDQLIECDYNAEVRKALHWAAVLGTGVLKGPVLHRKVRSAWQQIDGGVYGMEQRQETRPVVVAVDPRFVWEDPDCGDDVQNGSGVIELEQKTKKQVRDLANQPGYIRSAIVRVLTEGPKRSDEFASTMVSVGRDLYTKTSFDVWSYTGEITRAELQLAQRLSKSDSAEPEQEDADHEASEEQGQGADEDELATVSACVVMINDTVVKVYENPLESGELPYDFYPWDKVADSPRGQGAPRLMRAPQRVINSAWRMMLDNAALCAGGQVLFRRSKVKPVDGHYNLYARKFWEYIGDDSEPMKNAMESIEFEMHQPELANIIKLGMDLADAETSTPMLAQGEQGNAPETVGGMQMLMNSSNVVLRRLVKQFDDYVTKRLIRRFYDYNMAYSDKEEIKGDYSVDARGSSALLVRDIQNVAFTNLLAAGQNPVYQRFIDEKKLFAKALSAQHIQPQDIMKTDAQIKAEEEVARNNPQPQDPRVQTAQIMAQAKVAEANARAQGDLSEIELRRGIAEQNHAAQIAKLELEREVNMLRLANEQKVSLDTIKAQLATTAMNNRQKAEQLQTEAQLRVTTGEGI